MKSVTGNVLIASSDVLAVTASGNEIWRKADEMCRGRVADRPDGGVYP